MKYKFTVQAADIKIIFFYTMTDVDTCYWPLRCNREKEFNLKLTIPILKSNLDDIAIQF